MGCGPPVFNLQKLNSRKGRWDYGSSRSWSSLWHIAYFQLMHNQCPVDDFVLLMQMVNMPQLWPGYVAFITGPPAIAPCYYFCIKLQCADFSPN